jgi:hypothetical protein
MRVSVLPILSVLVLATPTLAINFDDVIVDDSNKPVCEVVLKDSETCPSDKILTVGKAARNSLYFLGQDEQNTSGDERYHRGEFAARLKGVVEDLKSEEIVLIKTRVGKVYPPMVVKRVWDAVEAPKK